MHTPPQSQRIISIAIDAFIRAKRAGNLSRASLGFYAEKLKHLWDFCKAQSVTTVETITPDLLRQYMLSLEAGHNPGGRAAYYRAIRAFLHWFEQEYEPDDWKNPMRKVKAPIVPEEPLEPVALDDVSALLETCKGNGWYAIRDAAIFRVLVDTGVRASELINLNLDDYDRATGSLLVRKSKNKKPRTVFLGQRSRRGMRAWLRTRGEHAGALFLNRMRERFLYQGLWAMIRNRAKLAHIKPPSLHSFRRAFALNCLREGMDVFTLQRLMGHSDLSILRVYLAQTTDDLRAGHDRVSPGDRV